MDVPALVEAFGPTTAIVLFLFFGVRRFMEEIRNWLKLKLEAQETQLRVLVEQRETMLLHLTIDRERRDREGAYMQHTEEYAKKTALLELVIKARQKARLAEADGDEEAAKEYWREHQRLSRLADPLIYGTEGVTAELPEE